VSDFQRLRALFERVSELPSEEREEEIARATRDAPELADNLRALLEQAERDDSPLDHAAVSLQDGGDMPPPEIPGYRIHHCIGRGGSASVYLADQERAEFTRTVALKVVDRVFDGALRGVREEQRILAGLEYPGIARLYDAGVTPLGQPWLAMEHVEGESILEHCRARQLPVQERIELFLSVLDAVAYAHGRGIVHRDLKPANIFVTASGEPRLLDFGIAKLIDPTDPDATRTLQRALTPAYASPEQLRGDRTTTASDVYSLGVVLRELLAEAPDRERDRDIDAILAKALREQPEDRYQNASAMADDIRRAVAGTPSIARRDDRRHRARKLLRNSVLVFPVAIVVLLAAAIGLRSMNTKRTSNELAIFYDADWVDAGTRRWLREGADRLAVFDAAGARDRFRRATASGDALAWDGLARAESELGETARAADAARRASALVRRDVLPESEAERLRARALAANRDWNAAVAALEGLFGAEPERVDIGLDLVSTLLACGRTDAADTALGRLRQLTRADGDPRIDLREAEVALQLCEFQRAAAAASRARGRVTRVKSVAFEQRAARLHAEAIARLDRREDARRELEAVIARDVALGLTGEAAAARLVLGMILLRIAETGEARAVLEAARDGCRGAGDRRCEITARLYLALTTGTQGDLEEAIRLADGTLADARAIGDRWTEAFVLSQRLVLYNWADDAAAHDATIQETLTALRDSGNRYTLMTTITNLAITAIEALAIEKAEAYIVEAEGLARRVGSEHARSYVDRARGTLEEARGDLDLARESYAAALEKSRNAGVSLAIANHHADLAHLERAAGRPDVAVQHAIAASAAFAKGGDTRMATSMEDVLAWADARRGDAASARRRIGVLRRAAFEEGTDISRFALLGAEAHVAVALGDFRHAIVLRRETLRMATEWNAHGIMIKEQTDLAKALHGAGERRALEQLVSEMLPEVERNGLRGVARELRGLVASR